MNNTQIAEILAKYNEGTATDRERKLVEHWFLTESAQQQQDPEELDYVEIKNRLWENIEKQTRPKKLKLWPRIAVVAATITLIFTGLYLFRSVQKTITPVTTIVKNDIVPGNYGATLTLANGKKIRLAEASNGQLAKEAGIVISKSTDGRLIYEIEPQVSGSEQANTINTLSTQKGETYQVRLPDGSLVYLNAASSLTYNAALIQNGQRIVKLEGEGYFEIAKDRYHPFIVKTNKQEVEVLGTHFNISSYADDEAEKTTLLEGSVQLTAFGIKKILKPGEQGKLENGKISIYKTDPNLAVAWKNNEFVFESESIESLMKLVERWYNVEVVYIGEKTKETFSGEVSRFDNISKLLNIVESTNAAHFEIKGRKIYVSR